MLKRARKEKNKKTGKEKKPKGFKSSYQNYSKTIVISRQRTADARNDAQIFEEQRKVNMAEREKDREFMLHLGKIFAQKED